MIITLDLDVRYLVQLMICDGICKYLTPNRCHHPVVI